MNQQTLKGTKRHLRHNVKFHQECCLNDLQKLQQYINLVKNIHNVPEFVIKYLDLYASSIETNCNETIAEINKLDVSSNQQEANIKAIRRGFEILPSDIEEYNGWVYHVHTLTENILKCIFEFTPEGHPKPIIVKGYHNYCDKSDKYEFLKVSDT